jgi:N-acyl-D-amino-acid deacylase
MGILLKNGTVIDGRNTPPYKADVLISGNEVKEIGQITNADSDSVIDCSNLLVVPGFIDIHSHYDFSYFYDKYAVASVMQGITTEVVGNCGLGSAPINPIVAAYYNQYVNYMLGDVEFQPFARIADFMKNIETNGCSLNVAFLIPQGNVRAAVMKLDDRYPNSAELAKMQDLVAQGMEDGAYGLSTGLIYPPGSITSTQELVELCHIVKQYGGIYTSHIRDEGKGVVSAISEAIQIGRLSGVPVQISHLKVVGAFPGSRPKQVIHLIESARAEGIDITADVYPYTAGNALLSSLLQPWVFEGGRQQFLKNLSDPEKRQRILKDFMEFIWTIAGIPWFLRIIPKSIWFRLLPKILSKKVIMTSLPKHTEFVGKTLWEALDTLYRDRPMMDRFLDFLIEEEGQVFISMFLMKKTNVIEFMKAPFSMFSTDNLTTKMGNPHPRVYGTYPRILKCKLLPMEELIYKMTSFPAKRLGLTDRGALEQGKKADIVVFDPETVADLATHQNAKQFPIGIEYVFVNGGLTVEKGKHMNQLNGQILRRKK